MAAEGKRSKGRFLYLFDWNTKSRKKLFSNKSDSSDVEGSIQGKDSVDNLAISQYLLRELSENCDHSSFRGSGNYSSTSSVNGDDGYGTKAPGVVARLMGLDSMPTTASCEASSFASYEPRAIGSSYYHGGDTPYEFEQHIMGYSYVPNKVEGNPWKSADSRMRKVHGRPIERFQTEVLPPKSAKPISITHHKLLSPIKSPGFVPTKDAAYIMETAARIIDSSPQPTGRTKVSSLGSPSSSFRYQDLKEKIEAAQRSSRLPESPKTPKLAAPVHQVRGTTSERSTRKSLFKNIMSSQASGSEKAKNKAKSVPLPVQDKANVQKKIGSAYSDSRSQQQERKKLKQKEPYTQKVNSTRTPRKKSSSVLRQNNEKQNSVSHKDQSTAKTSHSDQQPRKLPPGDSSAGPSKIVSKIFVNAENGSKKVATTRLMDRRPPVNGVSEKRPSLNRMKKISRSKQLSAKDNNSSEKVLENCDEKAAQRDLALQSSSRKDMDVISFTFTSPIKKAVSQSSPSTTEAIRSNHHHLCADSYDNAQSDTHSLSPQQGLKLIDSGSLSLLLEQKLRELTDKIGSTKSDLMMECSDTNSISCLSESILSQDAVGPSIDHDGWSDEDQTSATCDDDLSSSMIAKASQNWEDYGGPEEQSASSTNRFEASGESHREHFNISNPECSMSGSWMSSTTASDVTHGNYQPSSPRSQEVTSCVSSESIHPREDESDFIDASYWELEYVRHMLHYAGLKRLRLDEGFDIIDPDLFDLLENLISTSGRTAEPCSKLDRRILFNCVTESVNAKYQRAFLGSFKSWENWGMLLQNEWLTEEVYKEVLCWQNMGNLMVDELVDLDMSIQLGRWLDFEIESLEEGIDIEKEIVESLIDELVADLTV
ncbi:uncharacterized protein LOC110708749 isoform X1 [Chenopodium quinoa]|uniref:uncharacterized protein LOC110708749 isoform X1 n=1 Tax=Chenopodium quinoa TaxID=63459 RepID=UPI000B7810E5|nr:uncharacterized protein LOC110708749 isoform X1 [Chenopodium quinoa]